MDGAMGQEEDVVEAVLTCDGDFHDPDLSSRIEKFRHRLKDLLLTEKQKLLIKKVEPWNSVKVTLTIPREAASRLRQLAHNGNDALRQMGILSVQIQGDSQISLTFAGRNNEPTEFVLRTPSSLQLSSATTEPSCPVPNELATSPGPSNDEVTRKNIVDYLRHGSSVGQNPSLFETIMGVGTSPTSGLGIGLSPNAFQGPHIPSFRPNNIASQTVQNQTLRGSRNTFSFTNSTGAFHPPIPRLPASAGQSSATKSTHNFQPGNRPIGQIVTMGQANNSLQQTLQTNISSFNPVGPLRLSAPLSPSFHSQTSLVPPSSPTSNMMLDLPPPPPYPHSVNSSKPGKPVTASSPLLVNLLQTDPLAVAAGMASGNPNKPLTVGDSGGPPPKKKKRSKKSKDLKPAFPPHLIANTGVELSRGMPSVPNDNVTVTLSPQFRDTYSLDLVPSRTGILPTNHIPNSSMPSFRPDSKPLFSTDRPFGENPADVPSTKIDISRNGNNSSQVSDSAKDLDPFTVEIAAGKIINPYTGQLEPRDSLVDSGQPNHTSQMISRNVSELEELNKMSVPICSSKALDVHATAGFVRSGGQLQMAGDRILSNPIRYSVSEESTSSSSNIYAVTPWQEIASNVEESLPNSSVRNISKSNVHQRNTVSGPVNGPILSGHVVPSQQESKDSSCSSGSMIYTSSSSTSQTVFSQPQTHQIVSVTPGNEESSQILSRPLSSFTSLHSVQSSSPSLVSFSNQQKQAASSDAVQATKYGSSHLLNSLPEKHIDSQSSTESPPEKMSSEGEENSNHSGLAADSVHSGTTTLLEHSGVKVENHDSGVGSSSERSDDTPSEPGDSEFRSSHTGTDNDEGSGKTQPPKTAPTKVDIKPTVTNTITVGYIMNPGENTLQTKIIHPKYSSQVNKTSLVTCTQTSTSCDITRLLDTHKISMENKSVVQTSGQQINWASHLHDSYIGKLKDDLKGDIHSQKMNGPTGTTDKTLIAINETTQQKKLRNSPKQNSKKDQIKLEDDVLETKLQQFTESAKISPANSSEHSDAMETHTREERPDHLILEMEELVNGKTGNGNIGMEGKGGNNITSIYSKRSSPVNVNMLNHIYAPGLPLPRRLTESVQRVVKPLPASESSVAMPQVRPCKSSSAGGSPRAGSGSSRSCIQSGTRSPGASVPKLVAHDKHSLLSGGLDLAGLSNFPSSESSFIHCKTVNSVDSKTLQASELSPSKLLDTKCYSGKMLSQSFPPHKSRDSVFSRSKNDSTQDSRLTICWSNHVTTDSSASSNSNRQEAASDTAHSTKDNSTSHSNASSPLMPVLQRAQEPLLTPSISSQQTSISSPHIGSSAPALALHVPYAISTMSNSTCSSPGPLPTLYPMSITCTMSGGADTALVTSTGSILPELCAPPKLTKITLPNTPTSHSTRNIFESVSGSLTNDKLDEGIHSIGPLLTLESQWNPMKSDSSSKPHSDNVDVANETITSVSSHTSLTKIKEPILETISSSLATSSSLSVKEPKLETISSPVTTQSSVTVTEVKPDTDSTSVTISSSVSVKETKLESISSSLATHSSVSVVKDLLPETKAAISSFVASSAEEHGKNDKDMDSPMVTIQSKSLEHVTRSQPHSDSHLLNNDSQLPLDSEGSVRRVTRKRKSTHSEGDGQSDAPAELIPVSTIKSTPKTLTCIQSGLTSVKSSAQPKTPMLGNGVPSKATEETKTIHSFTEKRESENRNLSSSLDQSKDIRTPRATSSDGKESLHKENRSQRASSADDIKVKPNQGSLDTKDEGHKKSHRIKRQFYAYVPEKSIDQTYFDTPILSGRTRSKNKSTDINQDSAPSQEATVGTIDTQQHNHTDAVKVDPEPGGTKRPTRSVRAKDNSQDQSASKRRKVHQHR
ncbi:mucin-5AC-like isoform X2 [Physella acuta]|uniref:mucin-5AC-like isoform X2 n=1 Tax=Physella acuta TaxID=109671 RepID=UPI0027DE5A2B|nr:mucin-5AC-like isoform X2 [Physella acuta]